MFESFCKEKLGPLALRLAVGFVCVYHGFLKIMAAGGTAWSPGLAVGWQLLLSWGEFAAGLAILFGLYCRLAAAAVLTLTVSSLLLWQGWNTFQLPLRSLEPFILLLLVSLALLFVGPGELSLDRRSGGGGKPSSGRMPKKAAA